MTAISGPLSRFYSRALWRLLKVPSRVLYGLGLGPVQGRFVLLLTTTGRKSGRPRVTPVQYEKIDGAYVVGSARGTGADWYLNILSNPFVEVRVKSRQFKALAEPVDDPRRIADFLELRLQKHPRMLGAMFRAQGYPARPGRDDIERYSSGRAMVILRPIVEERNSD